MPPLPSPLLLPIITIFRYKRYRFLGLSFFFSSFTSFTAFLVYQYNHFILHTEKKPNCIEYWLHLLNEHLCIEEMETRQHGNQVPKFFLFLFALRRREAKTILTQWRPCSSFLKVGTYRLFVFCICCDRTFPQRSSRLYCLRHGY